MDKVTSKDINKFLVYVLSNEKQSLKTNPFHDENEKHKLKNQIFLYLEEQAKEIIKVASPILDTTLSESDIQDVMTFLDENQEANGYYYGDIGLLLLGKYKESYELMLKVE